jgi:hypothetical protein
LVKPVLRILIILALVFSAFIGKAQNRDSSVQRSDTVRTAVKAASPKSTPVVKSAARIELEKMPRRAAIRSAIIPGWGQLTNRRWWKLPLVYGGFVGLALVYDFNQTNYKIFLTEAQNREFNEANPALDPRPVNPAYQHLLTTGIISIKDSYRRDRDLTILAGAAFYAITIIDAYVDAKFFRFDITDELALKVKPTLQAAPGYAAFASPVPSVKLSLALTK